ncbi:septum site-determining protein MinC [Listeria ilorinensis]|uniref:septum site-determining protein MinC n=1 Tax=Listeria ilorinensis TaxID=2867439 RepID=UPI001EF493CB|nr:septum site-determining protein MinC [Listeria ilorinensis]
MKKNVQIKGTKDGIQIFLNDQAGVSELEEELLILLREQKQAPYGGEKLPVQVSIGNRLFSEEEEQRIAKIIKENSQMDIKSFYSNVMTKEAAKKWKEEDQVYRMATIIRSGQIIHVPGDFLLIGDINPGGQIRADGSIYILGKIKGIVHAGFSGDQRSVVAGKFLYPSQVRIAEKYYRFDDEAYKEVEDTTLSSAYVNEKEEVIIDEIHNIRKVRPEISNFEGGY